MQVNKHFFIICYSRCPQDKENSEVDNSGITDLNVVTSNISESNFEENRGERNDEEIPICQSVDIGDVDSELNIHTASVESQVYYIIRYIHVHICLPHL